MRKNKPVHRAQHTKKQKYERAKQFLFFCVRTSPRSSSHFKSIYFSFRSKTQSGECEFYDVDDDEVFNQEPYVSDVEGEDERERWFDVRARIFFVHISFFSIHRLSTSESEFGCSI